MKERKKINQIKIALFLHLYEESPSGPLKRFSYSIFILFIVDCTELIGVCYKSLVERYPVPDFICYNIVRTSFFSLLGMLVQRQRQSCVDRVQTEL